MMKYICMGDTNFLDSVYCPWSVIDDTKSGLFVFRVFLEASEIDFQRGA